MAASAMSSILGPALRIDGSVLEGGGQILRNTVSLSALLSRPVSIQNIRKARKPPGLKNQHRTGIELAAEICSAKLTGAVNASTSIDFIPGQISLPGDFSADPITAGSITLLLQISLPCLLFSSSTNRTPSTLTLLGGTNASLAPQIDYAQHILFPFLRRHFGLNDELTLEVKRRGYAPKGGGEVFCSISPTKNNAPLPAISLTTRGAVTSIRGIAHVAGLPAHLARSMAEGATRRILEAGLPDVEEGMIKIVSTREKNENCLGSGSGIVLWAETSGGCWIGGSEVGRKGKDPESVGQVAADELIKGLKEGGCVDEWLQDQMIIFLALAEGKSSVRTGPLTLHTTTAIWVAEQITDARFEVEEDEASGQCIVHCQGIGYRAP